MLNTITKYLVLPDLKVTHPSHAAQGSQPGSWRSEIQASAGLVPPEASPSLAHRWASSPRVLTRTVHTHPWCLGPNFPFL